jgi:hypothetical protein
MKPTELGENILPVVAQVIVALPGVNRVGCCGQMMVTDRLTEDKVGEPPIRSELDDHRRACGADQPERERRMLEPVRLHGMLGSPERGRTYESSAGQLPRREPKPDQPPAGQVSGTDPQRPLHQAMVLSVFVSEGISFACVINDRTIAEANVMRSLAGLEASTPVTALLLDNESNILGRRTASLYNLLLRLDGPRYRIFCHADVTFPPDFARRALTTIQTLEEGGLPWGALGVVGRAWDGEYTWCHDVQEPAAVCSLDSCCLIVDVSQGLTFDDKTFDEFHCYVEDYCLQCHSRNLGVYVIPGEFSHVAATFQSLGSNWGKYRRYRRRLDRKWKHEFDRVLTT